MKALIAKRSISLEVRCKLGGMIMLATLLGAAIRVAPRNQRIRTMIPTTTPAGFIISGNLLSLFKLKKKYLSFSRFVSVLKFSQVNLRL